VAFNKQLISVVQKGVFNAVLGDAMTALAAWFVLFGGALFICGLAVDALEQSSTDQLPKSLGWSLLALTVVGVCLMPASGFWLAFPPALAILARRPISLASTATA
jgi:hypothetical protein